MKAGKGIRCMRNAELARLGALGLVVVVIATLVLVYGG